MTKIRWQTIFETDIPEVDEQHKKLVAMSNQLEAAGAVGGDTADHEMGLVIKKLVDYTQYHFKSEEQTMEAISFSERVDHAALHKKLIDQIVTLLIRIKQQDSVTIIELMGFLRDWLLDHIMYEDSKVGKAYRAHLAQTAGSRQASPTVS